MGASPAHEPLLNFLAARDAAEPGVDETMRSLVIPGKRGAGAVILLHGLTASPPAWRAVAETLAARGRTVIVPRLLLHGYSDRMTNALSGISADDLIGDISTIVRNVAALGEDISIAGHSLGATLALDAASREPAVARVVAVAPFLGIAYLPHEVHAVVRGAFRLLPNKFLWWDPVLRERLEPKHGYPRYPLAALSAGIAIADRARDDAHRRPEVRAIDIVLNERETSVNNRTAERLAGDWRRAGASIAVHRLRGLDWSHDIIEPARPPAQLALATLIGIIESDHAGDDHEHQVLSQGAE